MPFKIIPVAFTEAIITGTEIGKKRIDHIVTNKYRKAYERAAQVLGALSETYIAIGEKSKAKRIIHTFYSEKYNRYSAFRREVKKVVMDSDMLNHLALLG